MPSAYSLEFEKPLLELERQIEDLKRIGTERQIDIEGELEGLQGKLESLRADIYRNLTPIQRVMVARHPRRPYTLDYLSTIFTDFIELHGDRLYMDDPAVVGGWARSGRRVGDGDRTPEGPRHEGESQAQLRHAPPRGLPEGAPAHEARRQVRRAGHHPDRHARRLSRARRRGARPVGGARPQHPGDVRAPDRRSVAVVIGEGGSGGALALGVADRILMLENSVYSVISPEGCAAILWKDASQRERAAEALKLTADDLLRLKVIDEIVKEPVGGAHIDPDVTGEALRDALIRHVTELRKIRPEKLVRRRAEKYAAMGAYSEA